MDSHTTTTSVLDTVPTSSTDVGGGVTDDKNRVSKDEEEGGFLSGEEDFDTVSAVEEEEEDMDVAFVEPPEMLRPVAKLSESEDEGEESEVNLLDVEENGIKESAGVVRDGSEDEKPVVVEERGTDSVEESGTNVLEDGLVEVDGVKFTEKGDAVVETIQVDVNVAEPGVAVVEDVKPVIEAKLGTEKPEIVATEDADNKFKAPVLSEVVSECGVDNMVEADSVSVEPVGESLILVDGVKFTSQGDTIVESINVHVIASEPGVAVVEERGTDSVEESETNVVEDGLVEVDGVKFTQEGDAVVEAIKVDVNVAEPGVAVVEDVKPVIEAKLGTEKPEMDSVATEDADIEFKAPVLSEVVSECGVDSASVEPVGESLILVDGVKFTSQGDTIVESINVHVIPSEPGVAVVEDVKPVIEASSVAATTREALVTTKCEELSDIKVESLQEDGSVENAKEEQPVTLKPSNEELNVEEGVNINSDSGAVKGAQQEQLDRSLIDEDSVSTDKQIDKEVSVVGYEGNSVKEAADEDLVNGNLDEVEGDAKPAVDGVKLTAEGDSVVENVHLNVLEPGVVVVEDSKEDEKPGAKVAECYAGEALELSNRLDQNGIAEEIQETVSQAVDVPNEKLETGTDQGETQKEVDQAAHAFNASPVEDLDQEVGDDEIKRFLEEAREMEVSARDIEVSASDEETGGMTFGSSEAATQFLEELEQRSAGDSHSGAESSHDPSQMVDGQIVSDSDEEVDTDEEENGKELFDSAALAALLKAATGGGSDGNITLSAQDVSNLFSAERPAGLGSSLRARPAPRQIQPNLFSSSGVRARAESEGNLSEEQRKKLESIQMLRVKFLRLVQRLGQSCEDSIASQVLYRLVLVSGRPSNQAYSLDAAKRTAEELESQGVDNLNFSLNILVIGKSGVGKSATINSIFGENKAGIDAFEPATNYVKEISGMVDGVHIRVFDTPGLKTSVMDQGYNRKILASVKKATKKCPPDIVLYVDRLDSQTRDLNDLPMLKTITNSLGASIWWSVIVTLTHAASAPPDGPSGTPLSYEVFVAQRTHAVQQSIGQASSDLRLMNPSQMNPVSLAENHPSCRKNRDGLKVLPNGQAWRPQLLMFCYSMKILSEASALYKQQDPFDHQKLFGFRVRAPPLPYLLSWLLQSRTHPKLSADQGGDNGDSDIDLDDLSESEGEEEEDEYDQLPSFKPLRKFQLAKLNKEQLKAYYEEYDYRVKLLQKKQWKEELKRMKEMKKGKVPESEYLGDDADPDNGAPAAVPVPLPDMVLPPSFDGDNPAYRYRFLEPSSQFLARPVLDNHGWDHDCGYDGVNLEQNLAIASRFPAAVTVQLTKDKKEFNVHLDSSVAAKHGENASSMAGFDIQNIGKKLAYIVRGETKFKNFKKNKTTAGFSVTFLGENVATGVKIEDQIPIGKRLVLVGSTGTVRSQSDAAYGANLEVKLREADFPIGQDQSTLGLSLVKWRGDLALGANLQSQISVGRGSKVALRLGLNNKSSGQITVRTSTSDQLHIALVGIFPLIIGIYRAILTRVNDDYGSY